MAGDHPEAEGGETPSGFYPVLIQSRLWNELAKAVSYFWTNINFQELNAHDFPWALKRIVGVGFPKNKGNLFFDLAANSHCAVPLFGLTSQS